MNFLEPHLLPLQNPRLLPMPDHPVYQTELYLLAALLFYAYLLFKMSSRLSAYFHFLFDWQSLDKTAPGRQGRIDWSSFQLFCLMVVCFVTASLYLYQWAAHADLTTTYFGTLPAWLSDSEEEVLSRLFFFVVAAFTCRWGLMHGLSRLFKENAFGSLVVRLDIGYLFFWVMWAFPVLLVSFSLSNYLSFVLLGLGTLYVLVFLFKWFKVLALSRQLSRFSYLHIFLYLCALEILPFLCFYKLIGIVIA